MAWNNRPFDPFFEKIRKKVFKRDKYTCQLCNKRGKLHIHHIIEYSKCVSLRADERNLITLCKTCHNNKVTGNEHLYALFFTRKVNEKYRK